MASMKNGGKKFVKKNVNTYERPQIESKGSLTRPILKQLIDSEANPDT
jgi:hypothetical protein